MVCIASEKPSEAEVDHFQLHYHETNHLFQSNQLTIFNYQNQLYRLMFQSQLYQANREFEINQFQRLTLDRIQIQIILHQ